MSKEFNIENIDRNFKIETNIEAEGLRFFEARQKPFQLYGFYDPYNESVYKRLPDEIANDDSLNPNVKALYKMTAGGRVRFATDSPYIVIKAVMPKLLHTSKSSLLGLSGFDLYIDSADGADSMFCRSFGIPLKATANNGFEAKVEFLSSTMRCYTINFPLYAEVSELYIGLHEKSIVKEGAPYRDFAPIVYYGTSITQGACASRPGNAYQAMVSRDLNIDFMNIGFSDGGRGEALMADYLSSIPMSAFVCDYSTNVGPAGLRATFLDFYKKFREKCPDVPYIMVGRPDVYRSNPDFPSIKDMAMNRFIMVETYNYAIQNGDENVYYIDGESLFQRHFSDSCVVDAIHPNDLGFAYIAEAVLSVLKRIIRDGKMKK